MSREILFKAKDLNNYKWVEGYYFKHEKTPWEPESHYIKNSDREVFDIFENTLCQYTGKEDLKGIKIFENDIVKYHALSGRSESHDEFAVVKYSSNGARFVAASVDNKDCIKYTGFYNCEVVGNLYDDSELARRATLYGHWR